MCRAILSMVLCVGVAIVFLGLPAAASASLLSADGDFVSKRMARLVGWIPDGAGGGAPVPPQGSTNAQSPFTNLFSQNGLGVHVNASIGNPYFEGGLGSIPNGTQFLYLNVDFRNTPTRRRLRDWSIAASGTTDPSLAVSFLCVTGSDLYVTGAITGSTREVLQTIPIGQDAWYNVQLVYDLTAKTYSGAVTQYGGTSTAISTENFITDSTVAYIYSDEGNLIWQLGTSAAHDIDNFAISSTPIAAPVPEPSRQSWLSRLWSACWPMPGGSDASFPIFRWMVVCDGRPICHFALAKLRR